MTPVKITKTEIIEQLVDYEINWFNELDNNSKQQYLKDFFLNGSKGFSTWADDALLEKCVDIGMFAMNE